MPFEDAVEFWAYAYACCIVLSGNMELSTEEQQSLVKDLAEKILAGKTDQGVAMDYAKIAQQLIKAGAKYAKAELAKDASNLYSLKAEWWLPAIRGGLPKGEYADEILNIFSDGETTLVWYNPFESTQERPVCDGASRFPDTFLGVNLVPGSVSHDVIYRKLKEIARAFGVPESAVRKFADKVFASVNLAENDGKPCVKTVSTMTYWGVRLFGGIYHRRHIATATAVAALLLSGCAGCVSTIFEDPREYRSPDYEKVAATNALMATEVECQ